MECPAAMPLRTCASRAVRSRDQRRRTVVPVDEDLRSFLLSQQVLGADVHVCQVIRDARPIPPAVTVFHQLAASRGAGRLRDARSAWLGS